MALVQTYHSHGLVSESWIEEINKLLEQSNFLIVKSKEISQMVMNCSENLQILVKQSQMLLEMQQIVIFKTTFSKSESCSR